MHLGTINDGGNGGSSSLVGAPRARAPDELTTKPGGGL